MAFFYKEPSRTFSEYLLVPGYSSAECVPDNVSLKTPITKFKKGEVPQISMNIPLTSAIMQAVSNDKLAVALAKEGGISFIYCSQSVEEQAEMVAKAKNFKAGFVKSDSNLLLNSNFQYVLDLKKKTGHSTMPITDDGTATGKLLGLLTDRDYRISKVDLNAKVSEFMTPFEKLICCKKGVGLSEANEIIWKHKLNCIPIIDENQKLCHLVFRKDYDSHKENPNELLDSLKRYVIGAGINTHDFEERVPALVDAGADILCIDSSEGFTEWQKRTIEFVRKKYGNRVKIGAGNVIDKEGFQFLAECDADFVKVGIGGGSICITRETKGIGRGQATALIEVAKQRDQYYKETGIYIPICSDGGIVYDHHISLALAMGADFVMLGRYFARFDESPTNRIIIDGTHMKEYWGEGSNRAKNWQRYNQMKGNKLSFEEGIDSYVPYAGTLHNNVQQTTFKIKATMCNCGALCIEEFQKKAKLTVVSATSIVEGKAHDVVLKNNNAEAKK